MSAKPCYQPWSYMEIRDLFGDGEASGDIVRVACFGHSLDLDPSASPCEASQGQPIACAPEYGGVQCLVRVDPEAKGLPRQTIRQAVSEGADIILDFLPGFKPDEQILREVASLVRRLRSSGLSLTLQGLATSIRAQISRLEASLGRA